MNVTDLTVAGLRNAGCKVRVKHHRRYTLFPKVNGQKVFSHVPVPVEKGGWTEVEVKDLSGKTLRGCSFCSTKDQYCKRTGVKLALERLK